MSNKFYCFVDTDHNELGILPVYFKYLDKAKEYALKQAAKEYHNWEYEKQYCAVYTKINSYKFKEGIDTLYLYVTINFYDSDTDEIHSTEEREYGYICPEEFSDYEECVSLF